MPQGQEAVTAEDDQKLTPLSMASKQGSGRMAAVLAAAGFQARKHGIEGKDAWRYCNVSRYVDTPNLFHPRNLTWMTRMMFGRCIYFLSNMAILGIYVKFQWGKPLHFPPLKFGALAFSFDCDRFEWMCRS